MQKENSSLPSSDENIQNTYKSTILLSKKERWAQSPIKETQSTTGYQIFNMYTTLLPKGKKVAVSSGLIAPYLQDRLIFVLGVPPTEFTRNIEIHRNFISQGEINFKCVNYGECDFELNPLTKITNFVVLKVSKGNPIICDSLEESDRGDSGFGSTGVK